MAIDVLLGEAPALIAAFTAYGLRWLGDWIQVFQRRAPHAAGREVKRWLTIREWSAVDADADTKTDCDWSILRAADKITSLPCPFRPLPVTTTASARTGPRAGRSAPGGQLRFP